MASVIWAAHVDSIMDALSRCLLVRRATRIMGHLCTTRLHTDHWLRMQFNYFSSPKIELLNLVMQAFCLSSKSPHLHHIRRCSVFHPGSFPNLLALIIRQKPCLVMISRILLLLQEKLWLDPQASEHSLPAPIDSQVTSHNRRNRYFQIVRISHFSRYLLWSKLTP